MPPEQLEEVHAWLVKASHDLRAAMHLSKIEPPLLDVAVYHCQQAMEKALKAYLTLVGSPFAKTHALVVLVEQATEHDGEFQLLLDHAENLSPFAWRFRYPGATCSRTRRKRIRHSSSPGKRWISCFGVLRK